jgi:uncharacterized RmlC-like cupin family protein
MNSQNCYPKASVSNQAIGSCGDQSKVLIIDAGATLVARIKREHEAALKSWLSDESNSSDDQQSS